MSSLAQTSGFSAAAEVLVSDVLFPAVCSFLPGLPTWLVKLQRTHGPAIQALERTLAAKKSSGTPGLLPYLAIQERDLRTLRRLWVLQKQPAFRKNPRFWFYSAADDAATMGNVEALEWLYDSANQRCTSLALTLAVSHGHADAVRWLLQGHLDCDAAFVLRAMVRAAAHGHLDVLKALHESQRATKAVKSDDEQVTMSDAVDAAAENGHLGVVCWFVTELGERSTGAALRGAVANGHIPIVRFLWDNHQAGLSDGNSDTTTTAQLTAGIQAGVANAIRPTNFTMLRFLNDHIGKDAFPTYTLPITMQLSQDLEVFRFIHDLGRPQEDLDHALGASTQRGERMQFLLEHNTFSMKVLNKVLRLAESVHDKESTRVSVLALKSAIARKQEELVVPKYLARSAESVAASTTGNLFVPSTSKTTSTTASRQKPKTRRLASRLAHSARGQGFLATHHTLTAST